MFRLSNRSIFIRCAKHYKRGRAVRMSPHLDNFSLAVLSARYCLIDDLFLGEMHEQTYFGTLIAVLAFKSNRFCLLD